MRGGTHFLKANVASLRFVTDSEVRRYEVADNKVVNGNGADYSGTAWRWTRRNNRLDHHTPTGLEKVTAAVLAAANPQPGDLVVDLGCRSGQLSIPLAQAGALVLA